MPHDEKPCICQREADGPAQYDSICRECFVPEKWELQYPALDSSGKEWKFYLLGNCQRCRRAMRYPFILSPFDNWPGMLSQIYLMLTRARPFDWVDHDASTYSNHVINRARWYQQQDDLTQEQRNEQFLRLFRDSDQRRVRRWLEREHPEEPYTHPKRDRKSVLFTATLDRVRASGYMTEIEPILDYCLPNPQEPEAPDRDQYLTDYRFNIIPSLQFGGEGIYIDLLLEGSFDATERTRLHLGTIKTLRQDQKACELMGKLCGLLMFHGSAHVNENIHRYTPKRELEQEYERMLKKQNNKEGESTI